MWFQDKFRPKEAKICLIIWTAAVLYAIYQFTVTSQKYFQNYQDHYDDFKTGMFTFRKRDKADFEWETVHFFFNSVYPVMILYLFVCEVTRHFLVDYKAQQYFQLLFPLVYLAYFMGYRVALIALIQPILFCLVTRVQSKLLVWICNLFCLTLIAIYKKINANEHFLKDFGINHFEAYLNILLLCWMNLKCTSFSLTATSKNNLLDYFSYCFYFPTLFTGPFIGYEDFRQLYEVKKIESLDVRLKKLALNILRCVFWMIFVDIWLHFIYVNATSFQIELVNKLDFCSLCGYGYLMGQFFHLKYVVLYGLTTSLASFENIRVPSLPRCIGRVHLYSDMWKYFDPGLYNFLKMCIFIPSQKLGVHKFTSSFICFFFVYIWHGIEEYILIWATLNFVGVCLETVVGNFYTNKWRLSKFIRKLEGNNLGRLKCLLAAPLLAVSAVSNFYFFAGKEVGDVFVEKSFNETYFNKILLLFVLYCCCQTSAELRDFSAHRM